MRARRYSRRVPTTVAEEPATPPRTPGAGLWHTLRDRFGHLVREVSKFATVGGAAFLVDFAIFNYAVHAHGVEQLTAKTISTVIAATFAFVGNRFWTWRHRERSNPAREYALFFLFNAVGLGIGAGLPGYQPLLARRDLAGGVPDRAGRQHRQLPGRHRARHPVPVLVVPAIRLPRRG